MKIQSIWLCSTHQKKCRHMYTTLGGGGNSGGDDNNDIWITWTRQLVLTVWEVVLFYKFWYWEGKEELFCIPSSADIKNAWSWDLLLSQRLSMIKFSQAISRVKWLCSVKNNRLKSSLSSSSGYYEDDDRDGLQNVGFFTAQPFDLANSPRELHHNAWSYTSTSPYIFIVWCLVRHRMSSWRGT
jgi:hypothetical protein